MANKKKSKVVQDMNELSLLRQATLVTNRLAQVDITIKFMGPTVPPEVAAAVRKYTAIELDTQQPVGLLKNSVKALIDADIAALEADYPFNIEEG